MKGIGRAFLGGASGSYTAPPSNPKNVILCTGQSNADDPTLGDTEALMTDAGISNPAYYECTFSGQAFRNWYSGYSFDNFMEGTESAINISTISKTGTTVTVTLASAHGWTAKNYVLLANIDQSDYNTHHYITTASGSEFTFEVPSGWADPTESTGTAKRSGVKEKFSNDITALADAGDYVNIIGFLWMQGEGNDTAATIDEYGQFHSFLADLKQYAHTGWGTLKNTTIDPNFVISVGLTANTGSALTNLTALHTSTLRRYQRDACMFKNYAYWVETLDLYRTDGVHIHAGTGKNYADNWDEYRRRHIQTILQKANAPAKNGGDFDL